MIEDCLLIYLEPNRMIWAADDGGYGRSLLRRSADVVDGDFKHLM